MVPKTAVLLLSVAHEVNRISPGLTFPSRAAMRFRAFEIASDGPDAGSYIELWIEHRRRRPDAGRDMVFE